MTFSNGMILSVKHKDEYIKSELLYKVDTHLWWAKHLHTGYVSVYNEDDLTSWNTSISCVCGSARAGSPGHAYYCDYYTPSNS